MTQAQIIEMTRQAGVGCDSLSGFVIYTTAGLAEIEAFAKLVAAKTIAELESQEPYGWVKIDEVREHFGSIGCGTIYKTAGEDRVSLYTHPPQRTWVGLTDDEMFELWLSADEQKDHMAFGKAVETKLKEKNT
jgi:hypothetical protein